MLPYVVAWLSAGFVLAVGEFALALGTSRSLFLSSQEIGQYALAAGSALALLGLGLGGVLRVATRADQVGHYARIACGVVALALGGWAGSLLTEGRRVRDLSYRPLIVLGIALFAALLLIFLMRTATYVRAYGTRQGAWVWGIACFVAAFVCMWADRSVLPRSYPAFHAALFACGLACACLAAAAIPDKLLPKRVHRAVAWPLLALALLAPLWLFLLARQSNASYAVAESAPFTRKLLAPVSGLLGREVVPAHELAADAPAEEALALPVKGIQLQDHDVLLITVDALRADMLSAYGGQGLTPELDALAREGVVFRRAYSPAPHTSYALASLLTAKFMKPVLELPGAERDHPTLPDLLRRYSYRTAAFYPPAIFFVDGASFDVLKQRSFGFEYIKEMFAPGKERVAQLDAYLGEVEAGHPLFVWVHLFEPHEPYDPEPELRSGDSPKERYIAEVRASDRDIGALVRSFRTARPNATVIVTADHGEEFGEHGGSYHGTTLYEEQVRVPFIWSSPGSVQPAVVDAPVELVDIGSTLLSAAGVPREARMRGDDLGPLLAGQLEAAPKYAFSSVERRHMVTDGRFKLICASEERHCQLYDLEADPTEQRNLSSAHEDVVARLRAELDKFFSSIPRAEALAMANGVGFPEALARAALGSPSVGPELVPLLSDERAPVRRAAARALGELKQASALASLTRLRSADPDASVRAEASIAALALGSEEAVDAVAALLVDGASEAGLDQAEAHSLLRRAALVLSTFGRSEALPELARLAADAAAPEVDRLRAVAALGASRDPSVAPTLVALLPDVRLREHVAVALGELGVTSTRAALAKQLASERYEAARRAELRALAQLKHPQTVDFALRLLGMESSVPDGVRLLMDLKALGPGSAHGALLSNHRVRSGEWECTEDACKPLAGAALRFQGKTAGQQVRVTWLVRASAQDEVLQIGEQRWTLRPGEQQVSMVLPGRLATHFTPVVEGDVVLIAFVVTKVTPEIPPPPPEPWEAEAASPERAEAASAE